MLQGRKRRQLDLSAGSCSMTYEEDWPISDPLKERGEMKC